MAVLMTDSFEGGSLPSSFDSQTTTGSVTGTIDATSKVNGVYSFKLGATGSGGSYLIKNLGSSYTELYFKFSIFIPTAFAWNAATYIPILHITDNSSTLVFDMKMEDYGTQEIVLQGGTLGYTDTTLTLSKNTVHTVQVYFKVNGSTGAYKVWVDNNTEGSPNASGSSLNTGTTQMRIIDFGAFTTDGAFTNNIYLDDFAVGTTFIGTDRTKSLSDTISIADNLTSDIFLGQTVADTISIADNISTVKAYKRTIADTISIADNTNPAILLTEDIADSVSMSDDVATSLSKNPNNYQSKRYIYKVYDATGNYIDTLGDDVLSEPFIPKEINTAGSELTIDLARKPDSYDEGNTIAHDNIIKIYVKDQESDEAALYFQGRIVSYTPYYNLRNSGVSVKLYSLSYDLNNSIYKADESVEQSQVTSNSEQGFGTGDKVAQSFIPDQPTLNRITLKLRVSAPVTVTLSIHTDNSGSPSASAITNGTVTKYITSSSATVHSFEFNPAPTLTVSNTYWAQLTI